MPQLSLAAKRARSRDAEKQCLLDQLMALRAEISPQQAQMLKVLEEEFNNIVEEHSRRVARRVQGQRVKFSQMLREA